MIISTIIIAYTRTTPKIPVYNIFIYHLETISLLLGLFKDQRKNTPTTLKCVTYFF